MVSTNFSLISAYLHFNTNEVVNMINIKYIPVENCLAEWGNKSAVLKRFEGLKIKTLDSYLTAMRNDPNYKQYVINPSQKIVWINFEGLLKFLYYKQEHRYKRSA